MEVFLIASELSLFYPYFARNWPLLAVEHGFVALGTTMFILGVELLGALNKPASTKETLGLAFWRIVAGSGLIVIVLGGLNFMAVCFASFVAHAKFIVLISHSRALFSVLRPLTSPLDMSAWMVPSH